MKDRISKIITTEGLTPSLLSVELGVQRSGISHILSGRNLPSFDFLQKLLVRFPKLNAEWLILGTGSMFKTNNEEVPDLFKEKEAPPSSTKSELSASSSEKKPQEAAPRIKENNNIVPEIQPKLANQKIIEKMIVLYTDKTFSTYFPES